MQIELTAIFLRQQLIKLDISNREAAAYAGVAEASIYRWLAGTAPIPRSVVAMFQLMIHIDQQVGMAKQLLAPPREQQVDEPAGAAA